MAGVADAQHGRTGTAPLNGTLAEGCGIGEMAVVEDVVDVEALDG